MTRLLKRILGWLLIVAVVSGCLCIDAMTRNVSVWRNVLLFVGTLIIVAAIALFVALIIWLLTSK